ncbi:MAG: EscU/YscU/HrcU family type III secretion system export apparatus switch protein [Planctomycetales bacterium]
MAVDIDYAEKTEPATPQRRREVRARGLAARSSDLSGALLVLAGAAAMHFFGGDLAKGLVTILRDSLAAAPWTNLEIGPVTGQIRSLSQIAFQGLLPLLGLILVAAIGINVVQVGFHWTLTPLAPDLARISPAKGIGRIVSPQSAVRALSGTLKCLVAAAIVAGFVMGQLPRFLHAGRLDAAPLCRQVGDWLVSLGYQLAIGLVILAVLDYGYQLWQFERDLRMTKEELKEELRQSEGNPESRQRQRADRHRQSIEIFQRESDAKVLSLES